LEVALCRSCKHSHILAVNGPGCPLFWRLSYIPFLQNSMKIIKLVKTLLRTNTHTHRVLPLFLRIHEVQGSNLFCRPIILTKVFRALPQSLYTNTELDYLNNPSFRILPVLFTAILPFDATYLMQLKILNNARINQRTYGQDSRPIKPFLKI
jgi:hypothetical protein